MLVDSEELITTCLRGTDADDGLLDGFRQVLELHDRDVKYTRTNNIKTIQQSSGIKMTTGQGMSRPEHCLFCFMKSGVILLHHSTGNHDDS